VELEVPVESTLGKAVDVFTCCIFTLNAFTIVLPAFLVAGALVVFVPSYSVMKYLGAKANRVLSYGVAAVSGNVLTVCSCNVVPIFAGILRRGAGIGPAFCFVFAAPAIHIVNTVFTYQVIGFRLALWRFITVPIVAIIVGAVMALVFRRDEAERQSEIQSRSNVALLEQDPEETRRALLFLGLLIGVLFFGAWLSLDAYFPEGAGQYIRLGGVVVALALLVVLAARWFGREETVEWGRQTWLLLWMIVPIFIVAVIIIGFIVARIPLSWVMGTAAQQGGLRFGHPEGNRLLPVFLSAVFGTLMYFPMLTEVAFTKGLLKEAHFAVGPALALLLGGPGLSLPGLILVSKVAGWKKTAVYWATMVTLITFAAYGFGARYGEYLCSCQLSGQATAAHAHKAGLVGMLGIAWIVALLAWITVMILRGKGSPTEVEAVQEKV
jgi:uncharacterized membrane protein YraQ (UPF0718 family)